MRASVDKIISAVFRRLRYFYIIFYTFLYFYLNEFDTFLAASCIWHTMPDSSTITIEQNVQFQGGICPENVQPDQIQNGHY